MKEMGKKELLDFIALVMKSELNNKVDCVNGIKLTAYNGKEYEINVKDVECRVETVQDRSALYSYLYDLLITNFEVVCCSGNGIIINCYDKKYEINIR